MMARSLKSLFANNTLTGRFWPSLFFHTNNRTMKKIYAFKYDTCIGSYLTYEQFVNANFSFKVLPDGKIDVSSKIINNFTSTKKYSTSLDFAKSKEFKSKISFSITLIEGKNIL
jgi:hypothetical protein